MGYGVLHELNYFLTHCHVVVHCLETTVGIVNCLPGLSGKIYFLVVFDFVDSIKMQRQISL